MIEKNNIQKVLEWFFTCPLKEIHLRELARELKLSMPTIITAVNRLARERFVTVTKGRAMTTIKANLEAVLFIRLKRVNNLERLYTSGFVDMLMKVFRMPSAIICFGSYARGEDTERSDIDIAIVGGTENDCPVERYEEVLKRGISLHIIDRKKISKEFSANLANGIVLEGAV